LIAAAAAALRDWALGLGRVAGTAVRGRPGGVRLRGDRACAGRLLAGAVLLAAAMGRAQADEAQRERLLVTDPYIELHTGPAASFPIFFVAERHTWIEIELRHTDWYKVRTPEGKEGWVERHQLESTLTEAGGKKTFRDVVLDDYLQRRLEFGAGGGHFAREPVLKVFASYNLASTVAVEATIGQVQGDFSGTNFWHVDLLAQPWADRRLEPFFAVGVGRITNIPNASLVGAISESSNSANAMIGVRYHVTERLIIRLDTAAYTAFITGSNTQQYRATTLDLSFFF
jgi:opacity protein-like surface antigen